MKIPIITGPTAVGKTNIVLKLAKKMNAEIVCMDSRQIYKKINIGTAKPTPDEMKIVDHHLFDFVELENNYSAYDYRKDALETIKKIMKKNKTPMLVGGTGLYIDALIKGFLNVSSDYGLRTYLKKLEFSNHGILRSILKDIDPESYMKIHENDLKRTIRALEIYIKTGKKMSYFFNKKINDNYYEYVIIVLDRDRKELHDRINLRTEKMLENKFIDEVRNILLTLKTKNLNSLNTIGYKEVIEYLEGKINYDTMVHLIKRNTRRYARRQIIYFRKLQGAHWLNISNLTEKEIIEKILNIYGGKKDAREI
ncbi:tRNA dimethylallyltransferase [Tepiditoga spiralis]|uniref:tRNA dimethylallyltransferase n=1 Tax=Tepiditoga spiralis TaxID=2108365 RepID=A0A7G1G596_9BACT|nr:tRNA (adenosine(37)-N6)-dimethylallyltransferase MiaA [Tepiditoga spiralis]BBE31285.1 tRNA dimethylallyltransferase [Tepiditoga spiralis]